MCKPEQLSISSHMLKHAVDKHENMQTEEIDYRMKVIKFHRSSFDRQVSESCKIQHIRESNILLNSRSEYNRSAVPRLALKMGSRNYVKDRKEGEQEDEKERTIVDKIRRLRKDAGKRVKQTQSTQAPKRRKLDSSSPTSSLEVSAVELHTPKPGTKRKQEPPNETNITRKRRNFQQDIRTFSEKRTPIVSQGEESKVTGFGTTPILQVVDMSLATTTGLEDSEKGGATIVGTHLCDLSDEQGCGMAHVHDKVVRGLATRTGVGTAPDGSKQSGTKPIGTTNCLQPKECAECTPDTVDPVCVSSGHDVYNAHKLDLDVATSFVDIQIGKCEMPCHNERSIPKNYENCVLNVDEKDCVLGVQSTHRVQNVYSVYKLERAENIPPNLMASPDRVPSLNIGGPGEAIMDMGGLGTALSERGNSGYNVDGAEKTPPIHNILPEIVPRLNIGGPGNTMMDMGGLGTAPREDNRIVGAEDILPIRVAPPEKVPSLNIGGPGDATEDMGGLGTAPRMRMKIVNSVDSRKRALEAASNRLEMPDKAPSLNIGGPGISTPVVSELGSAPSEGGGKINNANNPKTWTGY